MSNSNKWLIIGTMSNETIIHNHKDSIMLKLIVQLHNLLNKQLKKEEIDRFAAIKEKKQDNDEQSF
ncbi:hypothetical protein E2562_031307 [Oryza meyeriana var. granulata]|uniref:Uncharacterized protein n=1 Tax=Oryza meyeriana var. granulata TaxID=110450 RepID=A0A6G1CBJ2_9ORYZ|nr:hypothetical protein E2562_031307 [Oryza meyeriana var. granulata]